MGKEWIGEYVTWFNSSFDTGTAQSTWKADPMIEKTKAATHENNPHQVSSKSRATSHSPRSPHETQAKDKTNRGDHT